MQSKCARKTVGLMHDPLSCDTLATFGTTTRNKVKSMPEMLY